jgi:hypothetical protein
MPRVSVEHWRDKQWLAAIQALMHCYNNWGYIKRSELQDRMSLPHPYNDDHRRQYIHDMNELIIASLMDAQTSVDALNDSMRDVQLIAQKVILWEAAQEAIDDQKWFGLR